MRYQVEKKNGMVPESPIVVDLDQAVEESGMDPDQQMNEAGDTVEKVLETLEVGTAYNFDGGETVIRRLADQE